MINNIVPGDISDGFTTKLWRSGLIWRWSVVEERDASFPYRAGYWHLTRRAALASQQEALARLVESAKWYRNERRALEARALVSHAEMRARLVDEAKDRELRDLAIQWYRQQLTQTGEPTTT